MRWIQLPISRIDPQPTRLPLRTDDHARTEALKRLLTLPLRKLSAEKLSQRVIGKWKRRQRRRHCLGGEYRDNTRCELLNDQSEGCDNPRLHGRNFLRRDRKRARRDAKHCANQQPEGPKNSCLHKRFPLQGNRTLDCSRPFWQFKRQPSWNALSRRQCLRKRGRRP